MVNEHVLVFKLSACWVGMPHGTVIIYECDALVYSFLILNA